MDRHLQVHSLDREVVDKVEEEEVREEVPSRDPMHGARAIDLAELLMTCVLLHFGVPDIYS